MIKAFYFDTGNYGDILTPYLLKKLWNYDTAHINTPKYADFIGVGSILESLYLSPKNITVWGSGFIKNGSNITPTPNMHILAVRGYLSRNRIIGFNGPVGDPGLLVSKLIKSSNKKYKIGFIPHYVDQKTTISTYLRQLPSIHYIDILQPPETFLKEVIQCEYIISSSLHGLITADSFYIPNLHVVISDQVIGDNYKFQDYYSSLQKSHTYLNLQPISNQLFYPTTKYLISTITDQYTAPVNLEIIQDHLMASFENKYILKTD